MGEVDELGLRKGIVKDSKEYNYYSLCSSDGIYHDNTQSVKCKLGEVYIHS